MRERRRKPPQQPSGWPRWGTVARFREAAQSTLLFPLIRGGYTLEVRGRENLKGVKRPFLIVSNHNMHLDWSMVLRALPGRIAAGPWLLPPPRISLVTASGHSPAS